MYQEHIINPEKMSTVAHFYIEEQLKHTKHWSFRL